MRHEGDALVAGPNALLFIGSPYLTSPQDLERYNLYLSDFPSHEIAPDHMLMTAAKQERAAEALRQAHKSNCALRETLAEALAQQEEETVRPQLNVSSAGRTLLQLLDELLVGSEVDLHKVMEARDTLLRAGSDLWRPLNVDWSKVSVGDSEVNEALTKLLLGHPLISSFEEECPTGQGFDSCCDGPGTGAGTGTGTPGGNSAHAHSGKRLDRPLPSPHSSRLLQPRQGKAPPAAVAASAAQAQVQHKPSSPLGRFPSYLELRMNSSMKPLSRNPSVSAAFSLHTQDVLGQAAAEAVSGGGAARAAEEHWQGQRNGHYVQYAPGPMCQACQGSGRDRDGNAQAVTCSSWFSVSGGAQMYKKRYSVICWTTAAGLWRECCCRIMTCVLRQRAVDLIGQCC